MQQSLRCPARRGFRRRTLLSDHIELQDRLFNFKNMVNWLTMGLAWQAYGLGHLEDAQAFCEENALAVERVLDGDVSTTYLSEARCSRTAAADSF